MKFTGLNVDRDWAVKGGGGGGDDADILEVCRQTVSANWSKMLLKRQQQGLPDPPLLLFTG